MQPSNRVLAGKLSCSNQAVVCASCPCIFPPACVQLQAVLGMVYGAHGWEPYYRLFCASYAAVRVMAIVQEALVGALLPPAR